MRQIANESDTCCGESARQVSETVMNMLRPDHAARLCVATPAKVNGGEDMVSYRLLSEEELLDNKVGFLDDRSRLTL